MHSSKHNFAAITIRDGSHVPNPNVDLTHARQSKGFSLLELLIVVAILASLSTAVVLGLQTSRTPSDAMVFANTFNDTRLLAISTGRIHALHVTAEGLQVNVRNNNSWSARGDMQLWHGIVDVEVPRNAHSTYIELYPSDRSVDFRLTFQNERSVIKCRGPMTGELTCDN